MDWTDVLRLLAVIGMAYGAWVAWKAQDRVVHRGRTYVRQKDGRYALWWGRIVRDPALTAALDEAYARKGGTAP